MGDDTNKIEKISSKWTKWERKFSLWTATDTGGRDLWQVGFYGIRTAEKTGKKRLRKKSEEVR